MLHADLCISNVAGLLAHAFVALRYIGGLAARCSRFKRCCPSASHRSGTVVPIVVPIVVLLAIAPISLACGDTVSPAVAESTARQSTKQNWPRWRGAQYDGIAHGETISVNWPEAGPRKLWQASVGVGFSTVSIVDGKLYTMGSIAGEGDTPRYDVVWCLDIDTGNVVWQHRYPAQLIDILHEGGPAATPTVQEGRLYTMSKEGHFVCLDAQTGDLLWQRRLSDDLGYCRSGTHRSLRH
jgi:hypothetical protein